jgi:hypothetical protein
MHKIVKSDGERDVVDHAHRKARASDAPAGVLLTPLSCLLARMDQDAESNPVKL